MKAIANATLLGVLFGSTILASPALAQPSPSAVQGAGADSSAPPSSANSSPDALPSPAPSASSDVTQLQEVVVTAQRTSQSLQQVPIAVTAVTGAQLSARGITDSGELSAAVPSLSLTDNGGSLNPFLRGVGSSGGNPNDEPSVATYIDGVYIASPIGNTFNFNNIERIEVLKGPQGTLFGRNATGGVIQIITKDPSFTPTGAISVGYGNYDTVSANGYYSRGLTNNIAADVAVTYEDNLDGYGRDIATGQHEYRLEDLGLRSKLLWKPAAKTKIVLSADYTHLDSNTTPYQLLPGVIGADGVTSFPGNFNTNTNYPDKERDNVYGAALHVDQDLDFARLVSISSFREVKGEYFLDQDATPAPIINALLHRYSQNYSEELQLLSPSSNSRLQWVLGFYYYNADYRYNPGTIAGLGALAGFGAPSVDIFGNQHTESKSGYGQATYEFLPKTRFTVGLRYTSEQQDFLSSLNVGGAQIGLPTESQAFDKLTWRFGLDRQFTTNVLGYVSYNRGVKSGGYNILGPGTPGYKPEVLDAYEAGAKSEFFAHRLRLNLAGYYYDYTNVQVQVISSPGTLSTFNAASAHIRGLDADAQLIPIHDLTLTAGFGYIDGQYVSFPNAVFTPAPPMTGPQTTGDASGNDIVNAPRYTGNLAADYRYPVSFGTLTGSSNISYRASAFTSADNRLKYPAYTLVNASVGWISSSGVYGVRLYAKNLLDRLYYTSRLEQSLGDVQIEGPPRTFGVVFNARF